MHECRWGPSGYADDDVRITDGKADRQVPGPNRATEAVAPQGIFAAFSTDIPPSASRCTGKHPPCCATRGVRGRGARCTCS